MDAVLAYLAPPQFAALATTSPRGPRFLLSIAAAVGTECAQRALVELLLARTAPDAVLGPYAGQVDPTHHVVDAMTDVEEPTAALLDALLLVASRYEAAGLEGTDKHTQVMFAIGAVGRLRPTDCGSRRGARRALEDALTKATAASDHTEAEYAKYRAIAEEEWRSWPRSLQGKWMATVHGWSHRGTGEAWTAGTEAERVLWANATVDAMTRQYARDSRARDQSNRRLQNGDSDSDLSSDLHAGVDAVRCAVQAMANLGDVSHGDRVRALASHQRVGVRAAAVHALFAFPGEESARVLSRALNDPFEDIHVRTAVVEAWNDWPEEHVQSDTVHEAVLRHLAANDGVQWDECYQMCMDRCVKRSVAVCENSCMRRCIKPGRLEAAVVMMAHQKLGFRVSSDESPRVLQAAAGGAADGWRARGGRRLQTHLQALESILQYTKFTFQAGVDFGWKKFVGDQDKAAAGIGFGITNILQINLGLFGGYFEVDINNWGKASVFILGEWGVTECSSNVGWRLQARIFSFVLIAVQVK